MHNINILRDESNITNKNKNWLQLTIMTYLFWKLAQSWRYTKVRQNMTLRLSLSYIYLKLTCHHFINKYCKLLTFQSVILSASMHQTVVIISVFLFITVNSDASAVFDPMEYQALVSTRFQEMDTILRHQAEQLKELGVNELKTSKVLLTIKRQRSNIKTNKWRTKGRK